MIASFNQQQTVKGVIASMLGLVALLLTAGFFYGGSWFVLRNLGVENRHSVALGIAGGAAFLVMVVGWIRGKRGRGHYGFGESGLHVQLEPVGGGAVMSNIYAQRVTAPTYVLGQLFLAAPLQFLKAWHCFHSRIPENPVLEEQMKGLLEEIRAKGKWQDMAAYQDRMQELLYLIRLGAVEFSPRKGRIRAAS